MPLEIKELHIKVTVNQSAQGQPSGAPAAESKKTDDEKEALIARSIDEMMDSMSHKNER